MCKQSLVCMVLLCLMGWSASVMSDELSPDEFECDHDELWTPTQEYLEKELADHLAWLEQPGRQDFDDERRAQLCNAELRGSALNDANRALNRKEIDLGFAQLNEAYLQEAELNGAELRGAELNEANRGGAQPNGAKLAVREVEGACAPGA